jgi:hypothetical protein
MTQPPHLRPFGSLFPTLGATPGIYYVTVRATRELYVVESPLSDTDVAHLTDAFLDAVKPFLESAGFTLPQAPLPLIRCMDGLRSTYHLDKGYGSFRPFVDYGKWDALCAYQPANAYQVTPSSIDLFQLNLDYVVLVWMTLSRIHPTDPGFKEADFEALRQTIVALAIFHALSLWVVHQSLIGQGQIPVPKVSTSRDSMFFHESLARILVKYVLASNSILMPNGWSTEPDFITLTEWMENVTSPLYTAYTHLGHCPESVLKALRILPGTPIQSFELLDQILQLKQAKDEIEVDELFKRYFHSPLHPDSQETSIQEVKIYLSQHFPDIAEQYKVRILANKFGL